MENQAKTQRKSGQELESRHEVTMWGEVEASKT